LMTLAAMIVVILLGIFSKAARKEPVESAGLTDPGSVGTAISTRSRESARGASLHRGAKFESQQTAQEIVANKVIKLGRIRREVMHGMAKRFNVEVPNEVERFFHAVESGRWAEIDAAHRVLLLDEKHSNQPRSAEPPALR